MGIQLKSLTDTTNLLKRIFSKTLKAINVLSINKNNNKALIEKEINELKETNQNNNIL
ncbi:MAG TPA: hypothetical protein VIQ04_05335 [Nitrososphaeraceae archaeon]